MTAAKNPRFDLSATIQHDADLGSLEVQLRDLRPEALSVFAPLDEMQQRELAVQAWRLGLFAMQNAYRQADEARLSDIGRSLRTDLEQQFERLTTRQTDTVERVLAAYFDPKSGAIRERLEAFTRDDGELMGRLRSAIGPESSLLASTLAKLVGAESPLLKRLDPERKDGVVHALSEALEKTLRDQREATVRVLDPLAKDGPVARLLATLREELKREGADRDKQLALTTASLDPTNPNSLLNRLVNDAQRAREDLLIAINPEAPNSPIAAIKNSLVGMLGEHIKTERERATENERRQRAFEDDVKATLTRLETRKAHNSNSAAGGMSFEHDVVEFVRAQFRGAAMTVEAVGGTAGTLPRCKVGDAVVRFTEESAFAGSGLVVEAKHDRSYSEPEAVAEAATAMKNRNADAGVFVMARSHASVGFPSFARHGRAVLVTWDAEDPQTHPALQAALLLAQCMAARARDERDEGALEDLIKLEARLGDELERHAKMSKSAESIVRSGKDLVEELRKGTKALNQVLRSAKDVLATLEDRRDDFASNEPVRACAPEVAAAEE